MSFADLAVMETVRLLDKVRNEGPKERPERPNPEPPHQFKPLPHKPKPPKQPQAKTDPLRILDPGRKKLSTVESQRILSVLDDSIKKVELVSLLPFAVENVETFSGILGSDVTPILHEHGNLQSNYDDLYQKLVDHRQAKQAAKMQKQSQSELSEESNPEFDGDSPRESIKSQEEDPVEEVDEEEERLKKILKVLQYQLIFSCKNVMRAFALNPGAVNVLRGKHAERDQKAGHMISYMNDLRSFILERLLTTPLEEKRKTDYLEMITVRERKNSEVIKKLSSELNEAVEEKEKEISKRNDEIRRLKGDLHQLEKFSEEHIRRTRSEAEKQQQADVKNSEGKQTALTAEVQKLRNRLATLTSEHRERELTLRKRKYKIETEVENWIQKYDQDMGEKQAEYEDLDAIYTEEKAQLNELEERFKTLETEYTTIVEERKIAQEKREREARELAAMIKAATIVQAFWRSYKCRKMLKAKNKKKGKKGKKGGKK